MVLISLLFLIKPIYAELNTDSLRILGIRVEFVEDDSPNTTGNGKFDLSEPSGPFQIDPPPHDRTYFQDHLIFLRNYFFRVSKGDLLLLGDIYPSGKNEAYQLDQPMTYYNPNRTPDENNTRLAELFQDAILLADADPTVEFSRYQSVVIFHAGVGKDVDFGFDETPQDIPSLFITSDFLQRYLGTSSIPVDDGEAVVSNGIIAPETESQAGIELGLNGILTANFGSQLDWIDLFSPETRRTGIGRFGLMDAGLFNGDGLLPALPCAWTRIEADWEKPININYSSDDEFTIYHTLSSQSQRIFKIPINEYEYFLVENRYSGKVDFDSIQFVLTQERGELVNAKEVLLTYFEDQVTFSTRGVLIDVVNPDIGLPGSGCLIWHIDENIIMQNREANRVNADPDHRGVDLEEADGSQDIGQEYTILDPGYGSGLGWVLDMWYAANNAPVFKNEFSPNSVPNSRSNVNRANSHIKIYDFAEADSIMTFRINLNVFQQHFPKSIDPNIYGEITSIKTSDLNFDKQDDLILTTDTGKILALDKSGNSIWSSDSFLVVEVNENILPPPVFFERPSTNDSQTKIMIILTQTGMIYGFEFLPGLSIDTLFSPIRLTSKITTHPIATYELIPAVRVFWGSENGQVYQLIITEDTIDLDSLASIEEPIKYVHINGQGQVVVISENGKIYVDNEFIKETELPYFTPVGNIATGLTQDGNFLNFETDLETIATEGIFQFDSPMITNPVFNITQTGPLYFVAGNNRLFSFNYNFTLTDNFPVKINLPDQEEKLPLSPLFNEFLNTGLSEEHGVLVTLRNGVIDGYDLKGDRLVDFPLALGDSVSVTPVLLDIDNDSDLEIATVTQKGKLYVWDLASTFNPTGWNQLYYNEMNSNRSEEVPMPPLPGPSQDYSGQLMPDDSVYNWPNPNTEDYTFIRYYITEQAKVNIKIYDLAGDLVKELTGTQNPSTANEVRWDLHDVQSGIYLGRIEAQNERKQEVKIIKIAVIK